MFKRFSMLCSLMRGDARLLWRALRHPRSPGWLKLGVLDFVLVPLAIRFLLNQLPVHLRVDIGAGPRPA